jgi:hypothetical protein
VSAAWGGRRGGPLVGGVGRGASLERRQSKRWAPRDALHTGAAARGGCGLQAHRWTQLTSWAVSSVHKTLLPPFRKRTAAAAPPLDPAPQTHPHTPPPPTPHPSPST